ncbi:pyocin knob domain-containing protein [Psychrobacter sp. 2Y5]
MAGLLTLQDLADGHIDAGTLGEFANEDKVVVARKGLEYPSAPMVSRLVVENGLLGATPFATKALMIASSLVNGDYAVVTDDSDIAENGFWQKKSGVWRLLKWNPIEQSKEYVNANPLFKPQRLEADSDIDELFIAGIYHIPTATIAEALKLPENQNGQLYVSGNTRADGSGFVFQTYINARGSTYQRVYNGTIWFSWKGNNADLLVKKGEQTKSIVTYGSSTLAHLADELQSFADNKDIKMYPYAVSGDTIAGTGMLSGVNKVTIKVTGGELIKDIYVPVTFTKSFGKTGAVVDFELDNGVTGKLNVFNSKFKANSNATVSESTVFNAKPLAERPVDATYIINSGKNDLTTPEDNTQYVIDKTIEVVKGLPFGADFIVLGHFSNTDSSTARTDRVNNVNEALRARFWTRYLSINDILFDDATWLKLGLTKTAADNTAISKRNLPPSLARDNGHLSEAMDVVLTDAITDAIGKGCVLTNEAIIENVRKTRYVESMSATNRLQILSQSPYSLYASYNDGFAVKTNPSLKCVLYDSYNDGINSVGATGVAPTQNLTSKNIYIEFKYDTGELAVTWQHSKNMMFKSVWSPNGHNSLFNFKKISYASGTNPESADWTLIQEVTTDYIPPVSFEATTGDRTDIGTKTTGGNHGSVGGEGELTAYMTNCEFYVNGVMLVDDFFGYADSVQCQWVNKLYASNTIVEKRFTLQQNVFADFTTGHVGVILKTTALEPLRIDYEGGTQLVGYGWNVAASHYNGVRKGFYKDNSAMVAGTLETAPNAWATVVKSDTLGFAAAYIDRDFGVKNSKIGAGEVIANKNSGSWKFYNFTMNGLHTNITMDTNETHSWRGGYAYAPIGITSSVESAFIAKIGNKTAVGYEALVGQKGNVHLPPHLIGREYQGTEDSPQGIYVSADGYQSNLAKEL